MKKRLFPPKYKWLFVCAFAVVILTSSDGHSQMRANVKGEVININRHLRVAFIDIGQRSLNKGDVIEVQVGYQDTAYMEVFEASAVISKVGVGAVVKKHFRSKVSDFDKIKIGNIVGKVDFDNPDVQRVQTRPQPVQSSSKANVKKPSIEEESEELTGDSHEISFQLEKSIKEIERLEESEDVSEKEYGSSSGGDKACQANVARCTEKNKQLESKISALRERLEYIQELINKNTQN